MQRPGNMIHLLTPSDAIGAVVWQSRLVACRCSMLRGRAKCFSKGAGDPQTKFLRSHLGTMPKLPTFCWPLGAERVEGQVSSTRGSIKFKIGRHSLAVKFDGLVLELVDVALWEEAAAHPLLLHLLPPILLLTSGAGLR